MTIEAALYSRLTDGAGDLYPLVATRVYPVRFPQDCLFPCVTYQRIAETRYSAMGSDTQIVDTRFQIDGWSETFDGMRLLSAAIVSRLQRWSASSPVTIQDTFISSSNDEYDDDAEIYRALVDVRLIYEE